MRRSLVDRLLGSWSLDRSPGYHIFDALTRVVSPYQINPLNMNPLRDLIAESVDFDCVRSCQAIRLFISATNVETGRVKVFHGHQLTADMVMASACLPNLFQAVEIDGVPYWDGGYMGNPSLFPFFDASEYRRVRMHLMHNQDALIPLGASSKSNAEWKFLTHLRDIGRNTAEAWLEANFDQIGKRDTVDVRAMFQGVDSVA